LAAQPLVLRVLDYADYLYIPSLLRRPAECLAQRRSLPKALRHLPVDYGNPAPAYQVARLDASSEHHRQLHHREEIRPYEIEAGVHAQVLPGAFDHDGAARHVAPDQPFHGKASAQHAAGE
jgi:hypothetical protein